MVRPIDNYIEVETQGSFSLWINKPVYKIYETSGGYIRNVRTGENVGQHVELHMNLYDENHVKLEVASYEEDCYELVEEWV
ncbi:MAG: hypothetical protein J1F66_01800 [Clostridiales bacterium]|nr:hypothetical protein [Clostridiales bacterium]